MKKSTVILMVLGGLAVLILSYFLIAPRFIGYHKYRIGALSQRDPSPDLIEFIHFGNKPWLAQNWHLSYFDQTEDFRKQVYSFSFKQVKNSDLTAKIVLPLVDGLDVLFWKEMGHSLYRNDEVYNYYVEIWASNSVHKIIEDRYVQVNRL